jgi:hypothetical protein
MQVTTILPFGPYSLALVAGLLLYWNASLILSRTITAFLATILAMKLDLIFHLFYACIHHTVIVILRLRTTLDPQDVLNEFQMRSQLYVIADIASIALLVGNTLQYWSAALVTRIALTALVTRAEIWMRWWESQSVVEHAISTLACLACVVACTLQWAYYVLLPREEVEQGSFASLLLWYTSTVYIIAVGVRAACALTTALMRLGGYRALQWLVSKVDRMTARALEDSGLNPFSEVHELYMAYFYAVVCATTAWYYAPSSLPMWMQCFVLLRLYLIASASWKLQHYKQVLSRFPSVSADPSKSCAICRDDFFSGEHVTCLPCGHTFHGACVRSWLVRAASCPTCRQPVTDPLTWRTSGQRRPTVGRGRYMGSVQPLAPRLPAAAPHSLRGTQPSHRAFRGAADAQARHTAQLQHIEAERRSLAQCRQQLLSQLSPVFSSPASEAVAVPVDQAEIRRGEVESTDPFLFTDTPLAPVGAASEGLQRSSGGITAAAAAAAPPHHKRQRDRTTSAAAEDGDDEASPRPRRE